MSLGCSQLLIDLLLFGRDAHHGTEQIVANSIAIGGGRKTEPLALKQRAGEQPALIGAGGGQRHHQVVEASLDQRDRPAQHQLLVPCRA